MSGFKQVSKAELRSHMSRDERISRLEGTILDLETADEYVDEVSRLWKDAQKTFLTIGRYLLKAERQFEGEFQAMVENHLPFGYQISYQLRCVARAIDGGKFSAEELPGSYATIYQLTTLDDDQLAMARSQTPTLIRPDVKRNEIVEFKRELAKAKPRDAVAIPRRIAQLSRRKATLTSRMTEIEKELTAINEELARLM